MDTRGTGGRSPAPRRITSTQVQDNDNTGTGAICTTCMEGCVSVVVRGGEGEKEKGTDQTPISWRTAQEWVPPSWMLLCGGFLLSCPVSSVHGRTGKPQHSSRDVFCSRAQQMREATAQWLGFPSLVPLQSSSRSHHPYPSCLPLLLR